MKEFISNYSEFLPRDFVLCDVGARWGTPAPWSYYAPILEVIGFEPDEIEYKKLLKVHKKGRIFNCALYKKSQDIILHLTKERGCSSIYRPNIAFLSKFPGTDNFEVEDSVTVRAVALDELTQNERIKNIDFIKIDIQGAELDVLEGGRQFLNEHALGMELEVEFQPQYLNQPLFAEVDMFIRSQFGFELQDLKKYYWKYPEGINYGSAKGKLIFGEALYFRSPENVLRLCESKSQQEAREKLFMAVLMGIVYGYFDYSLALIKNDRVRKYIEQDQLSQVESIITSYGKGLRYRGRFAPQLSEIFRLLYKLFQPAHEGWASIGQPLGARKKFKTFY